MHLASFNDSYESYQVTHQVKGFKIILYKNISKKCMQVLEKVHLWEEYTNWLSNIKWLALKIYMQVTVYWLLKSIDINYIKIIINICIYLYVCNNN